MASLDVESLFTNVPVDESIDIILDSVYNHATIPPPKISRANLKTLLEICTKEAPFKHIDGSLYVQKDGVAMGSPLSCTIANFYMCHIENEVLESVPSKPTLYCRYVDDIYVIINSEEALMSLKNEMEKKSVLSFTIERSIESKLPFLDVLVDSSREDQYVTKVYTKPSKSQECINFNCEAPERYKTGVIKTLLARANRICSTEEGFKEETVRIKNLLVNNHFPNR